MDRSKHFGVLRSRRHGYEQVRSVVDEEGGGSMGSWACLARGYRADAGIYLDGLERKIHSANLGWSGATIGIQTGLCQLHIGRAKACADAGDHVSKGIFEELLADEEGHLDEFQNIKDHVDQLGAAYLATLAGGAAE